MHICKYLMFLCAAVLLSGSSPVFAQRLVFGNPSNATNEVSNENNYLVAHDNFILSYSRERGQSNWVAWHLSVSDTVKIADRDLSQFAPDKLLPDGWRIRPTEYKFAQYGYQRGHLCPSADKTYTQEANRETFLMSNMSPMLPQLNEDTWGDSETSIRRILKLNKYEAYIYAGCYGDKGKISSKITIPERCFKVVLYLPEGGNDLSRVDKNTRVLAVDMPNAKNIRKDWRYYLTTVDAIEEKTGYDLFSTLSEEVQTAIEAKKEN